MIIDTRKHSGPCVCGQAHSMVTQQAIIEAGCMADFDKHLHEAGLHGRRAAIYDTNTYQAKGLLRPAADQEIILAADKLRADDGAVASVLAQLTGSTEVLIAIGAGTIHDIVRYCAHRLGIPFVSCPTAASVDGYATSLCAMSWRGTQVTMPGIAPTLILADLLVISQAPKALARAGLGDAISNFTALADWKITGLLTNAPVCPAVESLLRQAAIAAHGASNGLKRGDMGAYAQLMYALTLSGMASQMTGSAFPASAAEHHLSYLMELFPDTYGAKTPVLHGEQAGVCTAVIADLYHRMAEIDDIAPFIKPVKPLDAETMTKAFGELGERIATENTPDCLLAVQRETLITHWEEIRRIVAEIPAKDALEAMLASVGAPATMADLGIAPGKLSRMLQFAPLMRNQLTLLRMTRMLKFRYASNDLASHAPSRKSRYADKAIRRAGSSKAVS